MDECNTCMDDAIVSRRESSSSSHPLNALGSIVLEGHIKISFDFL
jgi:hypothetical protein